MSDDLSRAKAFASHEGIIIPCDEEDLPLSVESMEDKVFWIAFESRELGLQSNAVNLSLYHWGQMNGLLILKFLHERIVQGGEHLLIINPGTDRQIGMDNDAIIGFLGLLSETERG